jgi:hypothetical protein
MRSLSACLLVLASAPLYADIRLTAPPNTLLSSPVSVVTADFDHDGKLDVAALSHGGSQLQILKGRGDGFFSNLFILTLASPGSILISGDWNNDGTLDLLIAGSSGNYSVLFGKRNGTFAVGPALQTGIRPNGIAVGRLDGDPIPDLAVAGSNASGVATLLTLIGNGDGTFRQGTVISNSGSSACLSVILADFTGRGRDDIVAACPFLQLYRGNGDGTLSTPQSVSPNAAQSIGASDFNHDGFIDLAFMTTNSTGTSPLVAVLLSTSNGSFGPEIDYPGSFGASLTVADVNGDGNADILFPAVSSNLVFSLSGHPDGAFDIATVFFTPGASAQAVVLGDFNGDAHVDLGVMTNTSVAVLPGDGTAFLQESKPLGAQNADVVASVDLNHDGLDDLVYFSYTGNLLDLKTALNAGGENFTITPTVLLEDSVSRDPNYRLAAGDLDGDGYPDIVYIDSSSHVQTIVSNGNGTFQPGRSVATIPTALGYRCRIADVNGDGINDFVVLYEITSPGSQLTAVILVYPGRGDGTFSPYVVTPVARYPNAIQYPSAFDVVTADFNHDGKQDLLVEDHAPNLTVFLSKGDFTFTPSLRTRLTKGGAIAAGDLNLDLNADFVLTQFPGGDAVNGAIIPFLGKGDGAFTQAAYTAVGGQPLSVAIADLDGDGYPEVISGNFSSNDITVARNQENGTFALDHDWGITARTVADSGISSSVEHLFPGHFFDSATFDLLVSNALIPVVAHSFAHVGGSSCLPTWPLILYKLLQRIQFCIPLRRDLIQPPPRLLEFFRL